MYDDILSEDYSFTVTNDDGTETICDTLAIVAADGYQEPLIIYTDYTLDNDKKFNLFVSKVVPNEFGFTLQHIDNYNIIPEITAAIQEL